MLYALVIAKGLCSEPVRFFLAFRCFVVIRAEFGLIRSRIRVFS